MLLVFRRFISFFILHTHTHTHTHTNLQRLYQLSCDYVGSFIENML